MLTHFHGHITSDSGGKGHVFGFFNLNLEKEKENEGIKIIFSKFKRLLQGGFALMAHTI